MCCFEAESDVLLRGGQISILCSPYWFRERADGLTYVLGSVVFLTYFIPRSGAGLQDSE